MAHRRTAANPTGDASPIDRAQQTARKQVVNISRAWCHATNCHSNNATAATIVAHPYPEGVFDNAATGSQDRGVQLSHSNAAYQAPRCATRRQCALHGLRHGRGGSDPHIRSRDGEQNLQAPQQAQARMELDGGNSGASACQERLNCCSCPGATQAPPAKVCALGLCEAIQLMDIHVVKTVLFVGGMGGIKWHLTQCWSRN